MLFRTDIRKIRPLLPGITWLRLWQCRKLQMGWIEWESNGLAGPSGRFLCARNSICVQMIQIAYIDSLACSGQDVWVEELLSWTCHLLSHAFWFPWFILDDIVDQFDPLRVCHLSIERVSSIGECRYVARPWERQGSARRKALPYSIDTVCSRSCKHMVALWNRPKSTFCPWAPLRCCLLTSMAIEWPGIIQRQQVWLLCTGAQIAPGVSPTMCMYIDIIPHATKRYINRKVNE